MSETIRVLLVDDQAVVRGGLRAYLETQPGLTVVGDAASGSEAVELAAATTPDVVLMDLEMPEMGGIEATRRVREVSPNSQVVVLTSFHDDRHVFPAINAGAISYLLKDAGPDEVAAAVRAAARNEATIYPPVATRLMQALRGEGQPGAGPGAGQTLGSYRLLERVGEGGMGLVYRAEHLKLGREAAVKVLPVNLSGESEARQRFEREAALAASLQHPHILPLWEYGEQEDMPYLVMPYVRGGTLQERLERGPLPRQESVACLGQLASALDYAHQRGVIHRDVKPANVLVDEQGRYYLADFGIARALAGMVRLTRNGVGVGTPEYMAPAQAQGKAGPRSDLYAMGVMLYQLLTGQVPYTGGSYAEILMKHMQEPLPLEPLRQATPPLPAAVEGVLQRALAKDPEERYQTGQALVAAIGNALTAATVKVEMRPPERTPPVEQTPAATPATSTTEPRRISRPLLIGGLVVLIALALLAVLLLVNR